MQKATNVRVDVCGEDGIIVITVEDDGIGFDTEDCLSFVGKGSGFGFFSIRERLRSQEKLWDNVKPWKRK